MARRNQQPKRDLLMRAVRAEVLARIIDDITGDVRRIVDRTLGTELTDAIKRRAVQDVRQAVARHDGEVRGWLRHAVPTAYAMGLDETERFLRSRGMRTEFGRITADTLRSAPALSNHVRAANALLADAYADFGNGMNGVVRGVERTFSDALRRQARELMMEGRLEGRDIREIAREVRRTFEDRGFTVLTDRGGKEWSLKRYSEMLTRTHVMEVNNEARLNRALDYNIDIVEVSDHNTECDICGPLEGNIYSISGDSPNFPKLPEEAEPPIHPNCKHVLLLRPDLS